MKNNKKTIFSKEEWRQITDDLSLSKRQSEIVHYILNGYGDKQISNELDIAVPTVRTHLSRIFIKFNLQDRNELILYIFRHFKNNNCNKGQRGVRKIQ